MEKIELLANWVAIASGLAIFWAAIAALFHPPEGVVGGVATIAFLVVFGWGMLCVAASRADERAERMSKP